MHEQIIFHLIFISLTLHSVAKNAVFQLPFTTQKFPSAVPLNFHPKTLETKVHFSISIPFSPVAFPPSFSLRLPLLLPYLLYIFFLLFNLCAEDSWNISFVSPSSAHDSPLSFFAKRHSTNNLHIPIPFALVSFLHLPFHCSTNSRPSLYCLYQKTRFYLIHSPT